MTTKNIGKAILTTIFSVTGPLHLSTLAQTGCPADCPEDIAPQGGDGTVNVDDLLLVIDNWGQCPAGTVVCSPCAGDVNGDGTVDDFDLDAVEIAWGDCPSPSITWSYAVNPPAPPVICETCTVTLTNPS